MNRGRSAILNVFLAAATLLVASLVFSYLVGVAAIESNRNVAATRVVLQHLDQLLSALRDAETAQLDFLLTGQEQSLHPYNEALRRVHQEESRLSGFAAAGELPATRVDEVLKLTREHLTELEQAIQIRKDSAREPALALARAAAGKGTVEKMRTDVEQMEAAQHLHLQEGLRKSNAADVWRTVIFVLTILFNLGFLVWAYWRVVREVHLREAAAQETTRQKEVLAAILASIGDGVITADIEGRVTFLNPQAERLTGWAGWEAGSQPLSSVFHVVDELSAQPVPNPLEAVKQSGSKATLGDRILLINKNGRSVPIDQTVAAIRQPDGALAGVVVVFRDVAEQRRNEETRAHLAAIVQSSGDAIVSDNLQGMIQSWNAGAERIFQYRAEEIIGKPFTVLLRPEDIGQEKHILDRIRGGSPAEQFETQRLSRQGESIPVSITVSPLKDHAGRIIGTSQIIRDITELVAARETLARGKEELERLVEARTSKLREMISELQHFSYSITHDMRAPLRAMGAFAQMLLEDSATRASSQSKDYCRRILTAAGRLDTLIRDALSFSRAVLQELPLQPVNLAILLRGIIETYPNLQPELADIDIEGNLPVVMGNESLLTQCFANLLGNAVKFVAPGVKPQVRIWSDQNGTATRVFVQDNGIGIPLHAQTRLFGMFQKLDSQYEGTGIGLAIVRKVAERMGGKVGVESEPGQGSRFWVELKIAQP
jgi:PAS domain S-box-containing protein